MIESEVSTGSGSDRVSIHGMVEFSGAMTRSLPLPVLTTIVIVANYDTTFGAGLQILAWLL